MVSFKEIKESFLHVVFPHVCDGCGSDIIDEEVVYACDVIAEIPETNFEIHANNPVEKDFWGRLPIINASAQFYFTKNRCAAFDASIEI